MNIFEKLKFDGIEFGKIQSVDEMTILPLLGIERTKRVAKPDSIRFSGTSSYGQMRFRNDDTEVGIIPSNLMVISEKAAQDHAMADIGLIKAGAETIFENACCVQQTQGGFLTEQENEFNILPLELRLKLLNPSLRRKTEYNKLWPSITEFLRGIPGITSDGRGHLEYFFRPFAKELEDFAAEFEPVDGQIGAIVFFGNTPVGIEIMPNSAWWNHYWKQIIRGCYGSQLLKLQKTNKSTGYRLNIPEMVDSQNIQADVEKFLNDTKDTFLKYVDKIDVQRLTEYRHEMGMDCKMVMSNTGGGDLVLQEENPVYLSMIFSN